MTFPFSPIVQTKVCGFSVFARSMYASPITTVLIGTPSMLVFGSDSHLMELRRRLASFRQGISAVRSLHAAQLVPPGFSADGALSDGDEAVVTTRKTSANSPCPSCGVASGRVHSRYEVDTKSPDRWAARRAHAPRAALPLCGGSVWSAHLHRELRRQESRALGAADGSARSDCPLSGARPRRPTGGEFRAPPEYAAQ